MKPELVDSGIDAVGAVPWGTHFCQFYQSREDLLDALVPYVAAGLRNNESCMWVTSSPLTPADARQALGRALPDLGERFSRGQVDILPHTEWCLEGGAFDLNRVLNGWISRLNRARSAGYSGLRVTGNTAWLEKKDWASFTEYEEAINRVIGGRRMLALCTYSLDRCGAAEVMDVIRNHEFALIRREGGWEVIARVVATQMPEKFVQRVTAFAAGGRGFAGIYEDTSQHVEAERRMRLLADTASELLRSDAPQVVVNSLCARVMEHLDCHAFFNFLVDEAAGRLRLNAFAGISREQAQEIEWLEFGEAICGCAARDRCRLVAENIMETPDPRTELVKGYGIQAYACHPLMAQERLLGTLSFGTRARPCFTEDELSLMKAVADMVAIAMQRKRTKDELRETGSYLDSLLNYANAPIIVWDPGLRITKFNRAFQRLTGYGEAEVVGQHLAMLFPDVTREASLSHIGRTAAGERWESIEIPIRRKDGLVRTVLWNSANIQSPDGRTTVSTIAQGQDITERKEAEDAVQKLNDALRQRAVELEAANKELEAFAYSVSHDLRTPLRSIDGFSLALLEDYWDRIDEQGRDYLRRVREASQTMGELIDDMLDLSRVTRTQMHWKTVDLSGMAHRIAAALHDGDPKRPVEFAIAAGLGAYGDPALLRAALENLLGNAWKFTAKCDRARIEFGEVNEDGRRVFFVKDNGIGFDMNYAGRLFEPFQRLHSRKEFPGTGVGLATVKRIVNRHGGRIWADSRVGSGATFYFSLNERGERRQDAETGREGDDTAGGGQSG